MNLICHIASHVELSPNICQPHILGNLSLPHAKLRGLMRVDVVRLSFEVEIPQDSSHNQTHVQVCEAEKKKVSNQQ